MERLLRYSLSTPARYLRVASVTWPSRLLKSSLLLAWMFNFCRSLLMVSSISSLLWLCFYQGSSSWMHCVCHSSYLTILWASKKWSSTVHTIWQLWMWPVKQWMLSVGQLYRPFPLRSGFFMILLDEMYQRFPLHGVLVPLSRCAMSGRIACCDFRSVAMYVSSLGFSMCYSLSLFQEAFFFRQDSAYACSLSLTSC